jgi:hypothetical protein
MKLNVCATTRKKRVLYHYVFLLLLIPPTEKNVAILEKNEECEKREETQKKWKKGEVNSKYKIKHK